MEGGSYILPAKNDKAVRTVLFSSILSNTIFEPPRGKTNNLHRRKQRRTSVISFAVNHEADQRLCFRYSNSTIPLLLKSEMSSF